MENFSQFIYIYTKDLNVLLFKEATAPIHSEALFLLSILIISEDSSNARILEFYNDLTSW